MKLSETCPACDALEETDAPFCSTVLPGEPAAECCHERSGIRVRDAVAQCPPARLPALQQAIIDFRCSRHAPLLIPCVRVDREWILLDRTHHAIAAHTVGDFTAMMIALRPTPSELAAFWDA